MRATAGEQRAGVTVARATHEYAESQSSIRLKSLSPGPPGWERNFCGVGGVPWAAHGGPTKGNKVAPSKGYPECIIESAWRGNRATRKRSAWKKQRQFRD